MQEAIATARQRRPFTILGALIALITLGAFMFVATQQRGAATPILGTSTGSTAVVVAKSDIRARSVLTADKLQVVKMSSADVPAANFSAIKDVVGTTSHFALIDIRAGQPVLANELVAASGDLTSPAPNFLPIPQGFVAMTIPTSEQAGVAGNIQPGDYIGIIAIVNKGESTSARTIFNNVHVIRVGTSTAAITTGRGGNSSTTTAGLGSSSLTIVMNECDAEYLNWFIAKWSLRYVLENYQDYDKGVANNPQQSAACAIDKAAGVSNADVSKRYGPALAP